MTPHASYLSEVAVDCRSLDAELAQRAAALLIRLQPHKKSKKVVPELLKQLKEEKRDRDSLGLNHWSEHAPAFMARVVRQARQERLRRYQETAAFKMEKHARFVRVAKLIVGDSMAAEIVAAETYRELLTGSATIAGAFTALICNARNYLEADPYREGKLVPWDEAFAPSDGDTDDSGEDAGDSLVLEPMSHRFEDQDPLDILIAREEESERQKLVAAAKQDPRWRFVKRKKWAAPLLENVPN